jgi:hypothetical protein
VGGSGVRVVERERKFYDSEAGCQVPAMLRDLTDNGLAHLRGEAIQFLDGTVLDILWRLYVF